MSFSIVRQNGTAAGSLGAANDLFIYTAGGSPRWAILGSHGTVKLIVDAATDGIQFMHGTTELARLTNVGTMAIGLTVPTSILHQLSKSPGNGHMTSTGSMLLKSVSTSVELLQSLAAMVLSTDFAMSSLRWRIGYLTNALGIALTMATQRSLDSAGTPGTNTWTVTSDSRTKIPTSIEEHRSGPETIVCLRPIRYDCNGRGQTPPTTSGSYVLRHRMVKEYVAWFDQVQRTDVTVASP